jgi:hypothetical protein
MACIAIQVVGYFAQMPHYPKAKSLRYKDLRDQAGKMTGVEPTFKKKHP